MVDFDSGGDQRFVMDTTAFAASPPADPRLIDLDMLFRTAAIRSALWPSNGGAFAVNSRSSVSFSSSILSATRSTIRRHGGDIVLDNRPGGGLVVSVSLPRIGL